MNIEFVYLIADYFKTLERRITLYDWVLPTLISIVFSVLIWHGNISSVVVGFKNSVISVLGILVGFSITLITIIITSNNENLQELKTTSSNVRIGDSYISIYRLLLINYSYTVVIEVFIIVFCLLYPFILATLNIPYCIKIIGFGMLLFWVLHVFLITVRNLTDFYFTISKQARNE